MPPRARSRATTASPENAAAADENAAQNQTPPENAPAMPFRTKSKVSRCVEKHVKMLKDTRASTIRQMQLVQNQLNANMTPEDKFNKYMTIRQIVFNEIDSENMADSAITDCICKDGRFVLPRQAAPQRTRSATLGGGNGTAAGGGGATKSAKRPPSSRTTSTRPKSASTTTATPTRKRT